MAMVKKQPTYIVGTNVNQYNNCGLQYRNSYEKQK